MPRTLLGREHQVTLVRAEVDRVLTSRGGLLLITGEAGIGKSALIGAAVEQARAAGALTLGGTCWDSDAAPELWPWTQLLRALHRSLGATEFLRHAEAAGIDPARPFGARSAPRPGTGLPAAVTATELEPDREFALFDGIAELLVGVSIERPLVLVLEDLHWADPATLRLLQFVSRHCWFERLLVIGSYRDTEVDRGDHPLHAAMAEITGAATTVSLAGLDERALTAIVTRVAGRAPSAASAADLLRRTGGNPFFIEQLARLDGTASDLAPGVREAVRRRIGVLPEDTQQVLRAAAVLGRVFAPSLVSAVAAQSSGSVTQALAIALSARIVEAVAEGEYRFVHDLVRETVLGDMDQAVRQQLHAQVVQVSEQRTGAVLPGELAGHAVRAGSSVPAERRLDLMIAAARDADARLALDEAISWYSRALAAAPSPARRATIGLDLGSVQLYRGGVLAVGRQEALATIEAAISQARQAEPLVLARIALAVNGFRSDALDGEPLVREAATRLGLPGSREQPLAAVVDALIAAVTDHARADGDDRSLLLALSARHEIIFRPGNAAEREQLMLEIELAARRTGDRDTEQFASSMRWVALLEQGDPRYLDQFRTFVALADGYRTPRMSFGSLVDSSLIAAFRGRFDTARDFLEELQAQSAGEQRIDPPDPYAWMTHLMRWSMAVRSGEHDVATALLAEIDPDAWVGPALLTALTAAESGRPQDAVEFVRTGLREGHGVDGQRMAMWVRLVALTASGTGDRELIDAARSALAPLRGGWCVGIMGCDLAGPYDYYAALVEGAAGNLPLAAQLFRRAIASADRMSTPLWATTARSALADLRGESDRLSGATHAAGLSGAPSVGAPSDTAAPPGAEFRREDAVWVIAFDGAVIHLPDAKGLADLQELLRRPGQDIPAVELVDPAGGAEVVAAARFGGDPVLDEAARQSYRRRLDQLDELIDAAALAGDPLRQAHLTAERETLISELRTATGLGGRSRRLGDAAERARKSVSARIRDTLRRIASVHPPLGEHLEASIRTGSSCGYHPQTPVAWRLG